MTQTQANDDGGGGSRIGRRNFVRLGIGAGAAAAGIGAGSGPAAAQTCDPEQSLSCSYGDEPDYGLSYLVGRVKQHFGGLGTDEDYQEAQSDSIHLQSYYDATTIRAADDSVLTTLTNLVANAKSVAYQEGRAAFLEALNAGDTVATAESKGITAIKDYIAPNQANLVERRSVAMTQVEQAHTRAAEISGVSPNDIWEFYAPGISPSSYPIASFKTHEVTLVDGSTATERYAYQPSGLNGEVEHANVIWKSFNDVGQKTNDIAVKSVPDDDKKGRKIINNRGRFQTVFDDLVTAHDEAKSELQAFASGIADTYQAGDIKTEDLVTPRDLWEMSSDDSETPYAAADLSGLGLEVNQNSAVVINLLNDGTSLEGTVYLSKSPIGNSLAVGNVYDPNLSRSTDADGNYTDTIDDYAGTESDPIPLDGLSFIAYNTDNGSTYDQIKQPFKVDSAFDENGEELQNIDYAPSTGQQTTTTDLDELRSELQSLNDEIIRLEEERQELATSSTGTGVFGGSDGGIIAAAAAGGALLFVLLGGGGN